ncbi:MAG: phospholipase D-like domain-containing protein [Candidatus Heimdallarchaeaceae archaeon]|jgi:phosphatidylserine/phosphatidylglycerophosphate/cardiolipin synthase-like enzyme
MNKKKIFYILILGMLITSAVRFSYVSQASTSSKEITGKEVFNAITTATFSGTTNITTIVGPDYAYDIILNSIRNAQTSIYLEVYTLSSEPLVNALINAFDRGVDVVVHLSDDRVNSFEDAYTEAAAFKLDAAGIDVYWTNGTEFVFTHAKFWIIDSQETFVYSGNWAPSSIPQVPQARTNREMGFLFNDASIAAYYENVFFDDELIATPYTPGSDGSLQANETSGTYTHPFDKYTVNEYAEVTPIFSPDNSYELLSSLIQNATTSIDLELQYMKFDCDLLDDVLDAALRGVTIRVLIPEPGVANDTETLINQGVQVKFFKGLGHNHNKFVSVDGDTVQISSINWSNNSVENNREAGAIVKNANIAAYFKTVFDYDWANSETPVGFAEPVALVSPKAGGIASGNFNFQANFAINTYTSGELYIDTTLIHTWSNPDGIESFSVDTTSYSDGVHTVKVVGTPTVGVPIEKIEKINVINTADWYLLITEIRYDATTEPNGEFIELYNGFSFDMYIEGWSLTDNEGIFVFPEDALIVAGQVIVCAQDSATYVSEMGALGITVSAADYALGDLALANSGDEIILKDPDDNVKDAAAWGSGSVSGVTTWTGGSTGSDQTLQRDPPNEDTNDCNVDFILDDPTPGEVAPVTPELTQIFLIPIIGFIALITIFVRRRLRK